LVHNSEICDEQQPTEEEITFLYRLRTGSSPKSYGINVARLARLPPHVLKNALRQSKIFEDCGSSDSERVARNANNALFAQFFDRLTSVIHSNMAPNDINRVVHELWMRLSHLAFPEK
jgi:DNA mismatch repair ATPase MutS